MKTVTRKASVVPLGILLLGAAVLLPAYAAADMPKADKSKATSEMRFKDCDTDKDGFLSLDEFKAKGKDDLSFKAADINGDERIDPDEYEKYKAMKATDQPRSGTDEDGQSGTSGPSGTSGDESTSPSGMPTRD